MKDLRKMKIAMTIMVRDEADIVAAMIDHHLDQGVDVIIVTDNGSMDGTTEILQDYADKGLIDLRHDPVHRKQQGVVVTQMAREASALYHADWVINADADEFWLPKDRAKTLRDVFDHLDKGIQSFTVDVIDMTGPPAISGTGLQRLTYRDNRSVRDLNAVGLHSHSTPDAVHIGDPNVTIIQGNHLASLESLGSPPADLALEVLHLPWRSWNQFSRKVRNAGSAYLNSSGLTPSPNHHGMRDYQRLLEDTLFPSYLFRHPTQDALEDGLVSGAFILDRGVADSRVSPVADVDVPNDNGRDWALGKVISGLEFQLSNLQNETADTSTRLTQAQSKINQLQTELTEANKRKAESVESLLAIRRRRVVRATDRIVETLKNRGLRK